MTFREKACGTTTIRVGLLGAWVALLSCVHGNAVDVKEGDTLSAQTEGGTQLTFRIERVFVDPKDPMQTLHLYELSVRSATSGWQPYCQPDAEGKNLAVPLSGTWDEKGQHRPSETLLTFACTNGVLGKCVRWGYNPDLPRKDVSTRALHQACTRMARADYCGQGEPHTRDGTTINIFDRFGIQKRDNDPSLTFEAAWGPDGAVYIARPRYGGESLKDIVARCPDKLKGRTALDLPSLQADDVEKRYRQEALLFNDSAANTVVP